MSDEDSYENASDEELIEAAHDCDPEAVGELFRRECLKTGRLTKALERIAALDYFTFGEPVQIARGSLSALREGQEGKEQKSDPPALPSE